MPKKTFKYDILLEPEDICNYEKEASILIDHASSSVAVKVFGRRNFGKTSLIKNLVARKWQNEDEKKRIVLYCDFYSVESLQDISFEMTNAFSLGLSEKRSLIEKGLAVFKSLRNVQVSWEPPTDEGSFGKWSFSPSGSDRTKPLPFDKVLESIDALQREEKFSFLLILDEFQEISKVPRAEALLRGALQEVKTPLSVIAMGSKHHLLAQIFNRPKAPFYQWGNSLELSPIEYEKYHNYLKERFELLDKNIDFESSRYLQDLCRRVPEAINRLADFIGQCDEKEIKRKVVDERLIKFVDRSRSMYSERFALLSKAEKAIVLFVARREKIYHLSSTEMLKETGLSPSTQHRMMKKLLDDGV